MDRNTVTGLLLIASLVIAWTYIFKPVPKPNQNQKKTDSIVQKDTFLGKVELKIKKKTDADSTKLDSLDENFGQFTSLSKGNNENVEVETKKFKISFSTKGAQIQEAFLNNYKTFDKKPLPMFKKGLTNQMSEQFRHGDKMIDTKDLYFTPSATKIDATTGSKSLIFQAKVAENQLIEKTFTFHPDSFHVDIKVKFLGLQDLIKNNYYEMKMAQTVFKTEKSKDKMNPETTIYYDYNEDSDYLNGMSEEPQEFQEQGKFKWFSFKSQFFNTTFIGQEKFDNLVVKSNNLKDTSLVKQFSASAQVPMNTSKGEANFKLFMGPNDLYVLGQYNIQQQMRMGWGPIGWIATYIVLPTFNFFETFISSYGIIILILGILIKLITFPLTYKSYLSTAKMRVVNNFDEIKDLDVKFKDDPTKLQSEKMKVYTKVGVSPFSGCLPLLLQIPIMLSMFYFFPTSINLRQQSFLWADDLSTYDSIYDFGFSIPMYGDHVSLFTILMTISTLIYTYIQQQTQGTSGPKELKYMGYIFPIIFLSILNSYSAGLSYYYFIMNVLTITQTYAMKYMVDEDKLHLQLMEAKNSNKPAKKTWLQNKMEEAQKQQEAAKKGGSKKK